MEYTDAPTYNEIYEQWFYKRSGLKVKDFEFSLSLLQDAYERGTPIGDLVKERIQAIGEWYMNSYLPCSW